MNNDANRYELSRFSPNGSKQIYDKIINDINKNRMFIGCYLLTLNTPVDIDPPLVIFCNFLATIRFFHFDVLCSYIIVTTTRVCTIGRLKWHLKRMEIASNRGSSRTMNPSLVFDIRT